MFDVEDSKYYKNDKWGRRKGVLGMKTYKYIYMYSNLDREWVLIHVLDISEGDFSFDFIENNCLTYTHSGDINCEYYADDDGNKYRINTVRKWA